MSAITMNLLPEDFREPPIYFCTACANYRQTDKQYLPGEQTFYQILLVTAGTGLLRHGNKTYSLSRGCAFFTALGEPSDYTDTGDLTTAFLTVRGNAMPQLLEHYGCGNFLFAQNIDLDRAVHAIREIIREYFDRKREGLLSAMAYRFYVDFLEQKTGTEPSALERICRYMERHFTEKLTLEQLAGVGGMSVSKLCHDFRRIYGCTVVSHILNLRLTYARNFIQTNREARTKDAALSCGFEDVSYFCKAYKKKFGKTPAQDRERG